MDIKNYTLTLDIDFEKKKYTGNEQIIIGNPGKLIELDIDEISVTSVRINDNGVDYKAEKNTLRIANTCERDIRLNIEFSTTVSDSLHGFYMAGTKENYILSTQFEPNGARRAFPCVDNPAFKSTFDLTLIIDEELSAISNMPIKKNTVLNGKRRVEFDRTPRMPSYILYIGIGHFEEISDAFRDKKIYMAAMKGRLVRSSYPIDSAKKSLAYLEKYTNIRYMLPKLHLISVPEFGAGAMENWGAITFREVLLNMDSSTSNKAYKRSSEVITHELVHHWFGDLVTMKWWNDLWLNESFATFLAFKTLSEIDREWDYYADFVLGQTTGAYRMDSLLTTHPINMTVNDPKSISQLASEIRYGKGANVLRMIEAYVGGDNFMTALRNYLKNFSYGNAEGADLWNSIEEVSRLNIPEIMDAWVSKAGYPYLIAKKGKGTVNIEQRKFSFLSSKDNDLWPIPLFINNFSSNKKILMTGDKITLNGETVSLNYNHNGFYRVLYDDTMFADILKNIDKLNTLERWSIINDSFAFLLSNAININQYLDRLLPFYNVNDGLIIEEMSKQLFELFLTTGNDYFKDIATHYVKGKIGFIRESKKGDFNYEAILSDLSVIMAQLDDGFCRELLDSNEDYFSIDPNLRSAYLIAHARISNNLDYFMSLMEKAFSDEDKTKILFAMGQIRGSENYERLLALLQSRKIKKQDLNELYVHMSQNPDASLFLVNNIEKIVSGMLNLKLNPGRVSRTVQVIISMVGVGKRDFVKEKLRTIENDELSWGIKRGLELLDVNENLNKNISTTGISTDARWLNSDLL